MRLVGGVEGEPGRDALAHPGVPGAGVLQGVLVGVDEYVDSGQVTHAASFPKTVAQSFFMLTTVQPSSMARARAVSAPLT